MSLTAFLNSIRGFSEKQFQLCFNILASASLVLMLWLSGDYGISWDEWFVGNGGVVALKYILTLGKDQEALSFLGIAMYYGQFFYGISALIFGLMKGDVLQFAVEGLRNPQDILAFFRISHLFNAFLGWVAMFYAARLARELSSWRGACIALILIVLSPRFFGHSMNNSKDIPFAAAYLMSLYYSIKYIEQLARPRLSTALFLIMGLAMAIGIRIGGILLFCYFGLFASLAFFYALRKKEVGKIKNGLLFLVPIFIAAYFLGLLFWPYGLSSPFKNPLHTLQVMSNYDLWKGVVLFEGRQIEASQLPWYYLFKWIGITAPLPVLFGCVLGFAGLFAARKQLHWPKVAAVLFAFVFPLAYILIKDAIVYDEMRHILFVYPLIVVFAALGWEKLFAFLNSKNLKIIAAAGLMLLLIQPLSWAVRNHPNQYVYFNPAVGGIDGAFGDYETDYFGNCIRESSEWLMEYHEKNHPYQPLIVRADGSLMSSYPYLKNKFFSWYFPFGYPVDFLKTNPYEHIGYAPYLLGPTGWDYAILLSRGWEKEALQKAWPPPATIHTVKADKTVLCSVIKNPGSKLS